MTETPDPGTAVEEVPCEDCPEPGMADVLNYVAALHDEVHEAVVRIGVVQEQLSKLVGSHNAVGENVAWLVANTQGLFQMLSNPDMINQMMGGVLGAGFPGAAAGNAKQQP